MHTFLWTHRFTLTLHTQTGKYRCARIWRALTLFLGVGMQHWGLVDSKKQFTSSALSMYALADMEGLLSGSVVLTTIYAFNPDIS